MNQPQEGAESILDHAKPTEPVNLTFWQTCKANPWPACVAFAVVLGLLLMVFWPKKTYESVLGTTPYVAPVSVLAPEPTLNAESAYQPQITPKKIARKAIKTPASGTNLPANKAVSDDVLGEFIAELERKKALPAPKNKETAQSASVLEQDSRLQSPLPPFLPFPLN